MVVVTTVVVVMGAREKVVEVGLRRVEDEARRAEGSVADDFSDERLALELVVGFISVSVCVLLLMFALAAEAAVAERWRAERVVLVEREADEDEDEDWGRLGGVGGDWTE